MFNSDVRTMTPKEAAEILGKSDRTIKRWLSEGLLEGYRDGISPKSPYRIETRSVLEAARQMRRLDHVPEKYRPLLEADE